MSMINTVLGATNYRDKVLKRKEMNILNDIRYLTNDEAASFLKLSPRTLEKQRVLGTGPRFRKFGRRVIYDIGDLVIWSNERVFDRTAQGSSSNGLYPAKTG